MQRWETPADIPDGFGPSVVTLGNFDGVHRGHRSVLGAVLSQARERGAEAVAVTFDPHPIAVLFPERAPQLITTSIHRADLLDALGLDGLLTMRFTHELAAWTPEEFVRRIFVEALGAVAVVVGADTRFGVRNSGDVDTLRKLGTTYGFDVVVLDDVGDAGNVAGEGDVPDGAGRSTHRWSSSTVRADVIAGDVEGAAEVLGRPHRVSGEVVHGDHRGRELGYPTANLSQDAGGLIPADGVYAGWLVRLGLPATDPERTLPAAISIGTNPTFQGTQRRVEAYVLDRTDLDLYGEQVALEFVHHLRATEKYDSVDALLVQMKQDVARCRELLHTVIPAG